MKNRNIRSAGFPPIEKDIEEFKNKQMGIQVEKKVEPLVVEKPVIVETKIETQEIEKVSWWAEKRWSIIHLIIAASIILTIGTAFFCFIKWKMCG